MSSLRYLKVLQQFGIACNLKLDDVLMRLKAPDYNVSVPYSNPHENMLCDIPPFACKFRRDSHHDYLAVANEDGAVLIYDTLWKNKLISTLRPHQSAIFDICWLPNQNYLLTCSGDTTAALFDVSTGDRIAQYSNHLSTVRTVDVCPQQSAIFATGSRDGSIKVWDNRINVNQNTTRASLSIDNAHKRKLAAIPQSQSRLTCNSRVSAVAFQNEFCLASAGAADGVVKLWDLRKSYIFSARRDPCPRRQMKYTNELSTHGCTSLVFDSAYHNLYACCTNNKIYRNDCHAFDEQMHCYEGFKCNTYFVKIALSSDDQYLLSGSSDHNAYIWRTDKPGLPIARLEGHSDEVTSVAWSPTNMTKIATTSDDNRIFVWDVLIKSRENTLEACPGTATLSLDATQKSESTEQEISEFLSISPPSSQSLRNANPITSYFQKVTRKSSSVGVQVLSCVQNQLKQGGSHEKSAHDKTDKNLMKRKHSGGSQNTKKVKTGKQSEKDIRTYFYLPRSSTPEK